MKTVIFGGEVHKDGEVIENGYVVIGEDGKIKKVKNSAQLDNSDLEDRLEAEENGTVINATGKVVAPGSIDMHTHGFGGREFMSDKTAPDDLDTIMQTYATYGTTSVSPTILSDTKGKIKSALERIRAYKEACGRGEKNGAAMLPVHLECRYFKKDKKGAHELAHLRDTVQKFKESGDIPGDDSRTLSEIILKEVSEFNAASGGFVKVVTVDPCIEGSSQIICGLVKMGYIVSIGHSDGTVAQTQGAIDDGATLLNHAFNCMSMEGDYQGDRITSNPNQKNVLGAFLDSKEGYAEVVPDFVHAGRYYVGMLIERKGIEHTVLVSDASGAAGCKITETTLGGKKVHILEKNGSPAAYYRNENESYTLCGSVLTMDQAIRNVVGLGYALNDAFRMASLNPARAMGIDVERERGSIDEGKFGDIAIYEKCGETIGEVRCTLVEGNVSYQAQNFQIRAAKGAAR